jgi:hypothetical protein
LRHDKTPVTAHQTCGIGQRFRRKVREFRMTPSDYTARTRPGAGRHR